MFNFLRVVVFSVAALFFMEVLSWWTASMPPCLVESEHQNETGADNDYKKCPTFFFGMGIIGARTAEFIRTNDNDKVIVAAFTVVLAISTIGLWFATIGLYQAGERQIETSRQIASIQAEQTRASVREARRATNISEQSLTTLQRAFVFPNDFIPMGMIPFANGLAIRTRFKWHNNGATLAKNVRWHVSWEHWETDIPADFLFPDRGDPPNEHPIYVAPHSDLLSGPIDIPIMIIEATRVGQIRTFIWGWMTYDDIFDDTPSHITRFCWEIKVAGADPYQGVGHMELATSPHPRYNCIDDDCDGN